MSLNNLIINNFRNIILADISLSNKINVFIGNNGSGKTNILESIYILGHGKESNNNNIKYMINYYQKDFFINGKVNIDNNFEKLEKNIRIYKNISGENIIKIDNKNRCKVNELAYLLPIQLITSTEYTLIKGSPKYRRAFIDCGCFYHEPEFFLTWCKFRKLLKQRNAALKQIRTYREIYAWDKLLIPLSIKINKWRSNYIKIIFKEVQNIFSTFLPTLKINFSFKQGWNKKKDLEEIFENQFEKDKYMQFTTLGPHRADFCIYIKEYPINNILSNGEIKLLICILRLVQGELISKKNKQNCLYIIDNLESELDTINYSILIEQLKYSNLQIFISSIKKNNINTMYAKNSKIFNIQEGKIYL